MTFLCDKHCMQATIVAMAAKMPEVILTEYGLFLLVVATCMHTIHSNRKSSQNTSSNSQFDVFGELHVLVGIEFSTLRFIFAENLPVSLFTSLPGTGHL